MTRERHESNRRNQSRAWQRMLSGRRLDLLAPAAADIEIEDIAHGLARVARWNGQTAGAHTFSVAQHSLLVEAIAASLEPTLTAPEQLAVLLHDAPEYVIGDLISPFKAVVGDSYKSVEQRILAAIHRRYDLPDRGSHLGQIIKRADRAAAFVEAVDLAGFERDEALRLFGPVEVEGSTLNGWMRPLSADEAERLFLQRFHVLRGTASPPGLGEAR